MPSRAAVVGGGIAGLAAADALAARGWQVELFEASDRAGGRIGSRVVEGCLLESGPDGYFAGTESIERLVERLGLGGETIEPTPGWAGLVRHGRVVPMPVHLWNGVPYVATEILRASVLGPAERLRLLAEPFVAGRRRFEADASPESLDAMLARRIGSGAARHLVAPLLAGVHAGRADELEAAAVAPALAVADRSGQGWLATARAAGKRARAGGGFGGGRPLRSLSGGMARLTDALAADLLSRGVAIRTGVPVGSVGLEDGRWCLDAAPETRFDALVLAVPAPVVARLLAPIAPAAAGSALSFEHADGVLVHIRADAPLGLAPRYRTLHGAIVPADEPGPFTAITLASQKWPGRAQAGTLTIRASLRDGTAPGDVPQAVASLLGLRAIPEIVAVDRQQAAFPVMRLGHTARVASFRAAISALPRLAAIGPALDGVGLGALAAAAARPMFGH